MTRGSTTDAPVPLQSDLVVLATPAPISHRTAEENLGLGYLAAVLEQGGIETIVIDAWLEGLSPSELGTKIALLGSQRRIAWVGFACYRSSIARALETVRALRATLSCPFVAGGYGPTFSPELFLDDFDVVVQGEAEGVILQLHAALVTSGDLSCIGGIAFKTNGGVKRTPSLPALNLDDLPFPRRDTLKRVLARRTPAHVSTSRGCKANCLFCSIVAFQKYSRGPKWRQRSIPNIVDELEVLFARGVRFIKVVDDSFIEPPRDDRWCEQFAGELARRSLGLNFRASIRADRVTEGILSALAEAGFVSFSCGIENFSSSALARINKSARLEQNFAALELFAKNGMIVQAGHILFDPYVTLEELRENLSAMRNYSWTISKGAFTELYAAEGTAFTKKIERSKLLRRDLQPTGNHSYEIQDASSRSVYIAMKAWHKAHMRLYDMAIDPVSAPKALPPAQLRSFLPVCSELRRIDLDMLEHVIRMAEAAESVEVMLAEVQGQIEAHSEQYQKLESTIQSLYRAVDLTYDGDENPFVC